MPLLWQVSASISWLPMVYTGFRQVMGFWKIMLTLLPRNWRICSGEKASTSSPSKVMEPPTTRPGFCNSPMME